MQNRAAQLPSKQCRFFGSRLGARDLGNDLASGGYTNALAAARTLEVRRKILSKVGNVDVGHNAHIIDQYVQINCTCEARRRQVNKCASSRPGRCVPSGVTRYSDCILRDRALIPAWSRLLP